LTPSRGVQAELQASLVELCSELRPQVSQFLITTVQAFSGHGITGAGNQIEFADDSHSAAASVTNDKAGQPL